MSNPTGFYPWLFALRGVVYDALHTFVHPDGYRLSDRVWRASHRTRNRIDQLLDHEIRQGTAAVDIAELLEKYLKPERKGIRTPKPYGQWGSFDARRLARTEITAAHGRAAIASYQQNPYVDKVGWNLSAFRDDWDCNCEANAEGGPYKVNEVPRYPDHPHCMCYLTPETVAKPSEVSDALRGWLNNEPQAPDFSGLFRLTGLVAQFTTLWR